MSDAATAPVKAVTAFDSPTSTTYSANCHCGRFQYTVTLPRPIESLPSQINSCDCSICTKNGLYNVYPKTNEVIFQKGSLDELSEWRHGTKQIPSRFCSTCGSSLFVDGSKKVDILATNIRMIKDIKLDGLALNKISNWVDGKEKEPKYSI